ncbi:unnamed protein product [Albugo candida]|uniref:Uncharacterized protein n=1 Tax=Albugo candida TaxID=65357 RepID=A0A024GA50_9STRA|nr:unnamed protein product [Albugo candida]|eukprot:CCI43751.1 unnamed protein product [Albugo candida]
MWLVRTRQLHQHHKSYRNHSNVSQGPEYWGSTNTRLRTKRDKVFHPKLRFQNKRVESLDDVYLLVQDPFCESKQKPLHCSSSGQSLPGSPQNVPYLSIKTKDAWLITMEQLK